MAAVSASPERIDVSGPMMTDPSPSDVASSDVASESSANVSCSADTPGRDDLSNSSPSPSRDVESLTSLRSEEYRQLFRLPPEEVLVQDFNCAFQESILLQGHMYLFVHHVCFYSNIFGFETKKIISFHEVTSVKRAKTAGIFPNAIEIFAGGKKYFFASFLSRDEAFKLINDGWLQHGDGAKAITEQQESLSEPGNPETGNVVIEKINSSKHPINELDSINRDMNASASSDSKLLDRFENDESTSCVNPQDNAKQHTEPVMNTESSSVAKTWTWNLENSDAPQIPEYYAKVTETKFPIKVEEFFNLFFSNDAVSFIESFHTRCGDKEFRCSSWYPHEKFGHARDVSFHHPIKIYFGAKFGSCQEVQKFRVYSNSHLVIETSQEINDVPYGDYFCVEGIWDVQRDRDESKDCCILRVYSNVAFTKRTVWKGKIVQSSLEECREVYAAWIDMAHDLLKQKNLEKKEDINPVNLIQGTEVQLERRAQTEELSQRSHDSSDHTRASQMSDAMDFNQRVGNLLQGSYINSGSIASFIRESSMKFCSLLKSHGRISLVLAVAFAVILLMQVSILVLLNRPQYIHVASPVEYMGGRGGGVGGGAAEAISWTEKRIHYLKDEMLMVEARLERMWHEHAVLKAQLKDLEELSKHR